MEVGEAQSKLLAQGLATDSYCSLMPRLFSYLHVTRNLAAHIQRSLHLIEDIVKNIVYKINHELPIS